GQWRQGAQGDGDRHPPDPDLGTPGADRRPRRSRPLASLRQARRHLAAHAAGAIAVMLLLPSATVKWRREGPKGCVQGCTHGFASSRMNCRKPRLHITNPRSGRGRGLTRRLARSILLLVRFPWKSKENELVSAKGDVESSLSRISRELI